MSNMRTGNSRQPRSPVSVQREQSRQPVDLGMVGRLLGGGWWFFAVWWVAHAINRLRVSRNGVFQQDNALRIERPPISGSYFFDHCMEFRRQAKHKRHRFGFIMRLFCHYLFPTLVKSSKLVNSFTKKHIDTIVKL